MWSQASGLSFFKRKFGIVDIEIRFENYYHGDEDSFDGPGGIYDLSDESLNLNRF